MKLSKNILNVAKIVYCTTIFINYLLVEPVFNINLLGRTRYIIATINIIIAICIFLLKRDYKIKKKACYYFLTNALPYILIFCIMIVKWLVGEEISLLNQITVFMYWIVPICQMASVIYMFGKEAIDYTFFATIANYSLCIIAYLYLYGIDGIIHFSNYVAVGVSPLEIHELNFTMGLFFLYYCLFEDKNEKMHRLKIVLSTICICLGIKRIEIAALIVTTIIYFIINFLKNEKYQRIVMKIISILCVVFSIIYIVVVQNGTLDLISEKYNINFKSRLEAFRYFQDKYEISITYSGKGLGYVMDELSQADSSLHGIGDLHNDILKLYIELGAIIWLIYFINFSILQTSRLRKHYGKKVEQLYFILMIFTYMLYLTDNVNRYLNYILVFTMIPYIQILKQEEQKIEEKSIGE